jgi:hypothetical protein
MCTQVVEGVWASQQRIADVPHFPPPFHPQPMLAHFHAQPHIITLDRNGVRYFTTGSLLVGFLSPTAADKWRERQRQARHEKEAAEMTSLRGMFFIQMRVRHSLAIV